MNLFTKRLGLVLAGVVGVGAIASLALGASFALFTAQAPTQNNVFAAGTLSLTAGSETSTTTTFSNLAPGSNPSTFYQLDLGGSLDAFVGLDATWTSTAAVPVDKTCADESAPSAAQCGTGMLPLLYPRSGGLTLTTYDSNQTAGMTQQILLRDSGTGPTSNVNTVTGCDATSGYWVCVGRINDIEIFLGSTTDLSFPWGGPVWTPGTNELLELSVGIPKSAGNGIQGSSVTFYLTGHAVQSDHNTVTAGTNNSGCAANTNGGSSVPDLSGQPCPVSWS